MTHKTKEHVAFDTDTHQTLYTKCTVSTAQKEANSKVITMLTSCPWWTESSISENISQIIN